MALSTGSTSVGEDAITLQDVAASGLVGQRLGEVAGLRLHLVEQAHVLDRDHRLSGEGLKQINGVFREFAGLLAPDDECANGSVGTQQRHDQQGAEPGADDDIENGWIGIVLNVRNLDRDASLYCFADHRVADVDMTILDLADDRIVHSVSCTQVEFLDSLVKHIDCTCLGAGELRRLGDDRVQDGFEVHGRIHRLADFAKRP